MADFLRRRWFLIGLVLALVFGLAASRGGWFQHISGWPPLRNTLVATVLFVMSLPLQARSMWNAIRRPLAPALATVVNMGFIPPLAWILSHLLSDNLAIGLVVAGVTPCTLASASVWTRRAGGNDAVSILVTIITNVTCFLVTPLWLYLLLGRSAESESLELLPMIRKMAVIVVAPMVAAQIVRQMGGIGDWATKRKIELGVLAQTGLLTMVFLGAIRTGMRLFGLEEERLEAWELGLMAAAVMAVHLAAFGFGWRVASWLGLTRRDQIAVGFAGSQKTLMVGLQVSMDLGVSILPMVTYHLGQLIADTFIADGIRVSGERASPDADEGSP